MQTITKEILENQIEQLTRHLKPKTGKLALDYAYGGVKIVLIDSESGHQNLFGIGFISKRKLSDLLEAVNHMLWKQGKI